MTTPQTHLGKTRLRSRVLTSNGGVIMMVSDFYLGLISDSTDPTWCHAMGLPGENPPEEFWELVHAHSPDDEVIESIQITYGITNYDPKRVKSEYGCQCLQCSGIQKEEDPDCLYTGVSKAARVLAALDPDLLRQYWNMPYYLYALALAQREAQYKRQKWLEVIGQEGEGNTETERASNRAMAKLKAMI